jgi:hypothetical protein
LLELPITEPEALCLNLLKEIFYHVPCVYLEVLVSNRANLFINTSYVICKIIIIIAKTCKLSELVLNGCFVFFHQLFKIINVASKIGDVS